MCVQEVLGGMYWGTERPQMILLVSRELHSPSELSPILRQGARHLYLLYQPLMEEERVTLREAALSSWRKFPEKWLWAISNQHPSTSRRMSVLKGRSDWNSQSHCIHLSSGANRATFFPPLAAMTATCQSEGRTWRQGSHILPLTFNTGKQSNPSETWFWRYWLEYSEILTVPHFLMNEVQLP